METLKTIKQEQIELLTDFANELKANGFTVLISKKHPFEWLHYEKNGNFGTVGKDHFVNFNFGTVHKPCRECGTGFSTAREVDLTIDNALDSLHIPNWATRSDRNAVKKYISVQEFINSTNNKWAEYYIL